jgi:hypothetical protein
MAARVRTRKQKMRGLRFIPSALAFETLSTESEGITGHRRHTRDAPGSRDNIHENAGADSSSPSWDIAAETLAPRFLARHMFWQITRVSASIRLSEGGKIGRSGRFL